MNTFARFACFALLPCAAWLPSTSFSQGNLNPPGAPAPTMKTLEQVEPRIDLFNAPASAGVATDDANFHFVITQPGSYYLTRNLSVTKPSGVSIAAPGVTLDLNGFRISRGSGNGGDGILVRVAGDGTTIKNGSVAGFANGIHSPDEPVDEFNSRAARACIVSKITASGCSANGFKIGDGWQVDGCAAHGNAAAGFLTGTAAAFTRCVAIDNGTSGFVLSRGSSISDSTAYSNDGAGFLVYGGMNISRCSATDNGGVGFNVGSGATIVDSSAVSNAGHGILVSGSEASLIRGNLLSRNGAFNPNESAGIRVLTDGSRIEGNNCVENDRGIHVTGAGNLIVKNSASQNALNNYQIGIGNRYGAIINATGNPTQGASGNQSVGTLPADTNPWANFAF